MLNNNITILFVSFVCHIELQNFLNAPRTSGLFITVSHMYEYLFPIHDVKQRRTFHFARWLKDHSTCRLVLD